MIHSAARVPCCHRQKTTAPRPCIGATKRPPVETKRALRTSTKHRIRSGYLIVGKLGQVEIHTQASLGRLGGRCRLVGCEVSTVTFSSLTTWRPYGRRLPRTPQSSQGEPSLPEPSAIPFTFLLFFSFFFSFFPCFFFLFFFRKVDYHDTLLNSRDIALASQATGWLNDSLLAFVFELFEHETFASLSSHTGECLRDRICCVCALTGPVGSVHGPRYDADGLDAERQPRPDHRVCFGREAATRTPPNVSSLRFIPQIGCSRRCSWGARSMSSWHSTTTTTPRQQGARTGASSCTIVQRTNSSCSTRCSRPGCCTRPRSAWPKASDSSYPQRDPCASRPAHNRPTGRNGEIEREREREKMGGGAVPVLPLFFFLSFPYFHFPCFPPPLYFCSRYDCGPWTLAYAYQLGEVWSDDSAAAPMLPPKGELPASLGRPPKCDLFFCTSPLARARLQRSQARRFVDSKGSFGVGDGERNFLGHACMHSSIGRRRVFI